MFTILIILVNLIYFTSEDAIGNDGEKSNPEGTNVFENLSEFLVFTNETLNTDAAIAMADKNDQMVGTSFIIGKFFFMKIKD